MVSEFRHKSSQYKMNQFLFPTLSHDAHFWYKTLMYCFFQWHTIQLGCQVLSRNGKNRRIYNKGTLSISLLSSSTHNFLLSCSKKKTLSTVFKNLQVRAERCLLCHCFSIALQKDRVFLLLDVLFRRYVSDIF